MDIFTVSLFRHREINDLRRLRDHLTPIIKELIQTKPYVSFLIGRNGEFDEYAASVIKQTQKEVRKENSDMTLVLPYTVADIEYCILALFDNNSMYYVQKTRTETS